MFLSDRSLPALLRSSDYSGAESHRRDSSILADQTWQLVATVPQLANHGDYISTERLGVPILLRNHGEGFQAYHNVCAHRGCRLVDGSGNQPTIKCPYHGWQYGTDGRTRKIPFAKNFPHFDREQHRLRLYPVRRVGQLLFVNVSRDPTIESIDDWAHWGPEFEIGTSADRWRLVLNTSLDFECDWKVPIEGSLESYHLDEVHSQTFGGAPKEEDSDHQSFPSGSAFQTQQRDPSAIANLEVAVMKAITGTFDPTYRHVHVFPNVMASFTNTLSLVYQIYPVGVTTDGSHRCRMTLFGFKRRSERLGWLGKYFGWWMGIAAKRFAMKVLREDAEIFPEVQAGIDQLVTERIFGRSEERLYWFHEFWSRRAAAIDEGSISCDSDPDAR